MVPCPGRIYPDGDAAVLLDQAAGGIAFLVHTLLRAGLLHDDVRTVVGHGLWRYTTEPRLSGGIDWAPFAFEKVRAAG